MGAGDTQLGALGAGSLRPGDCAVVAGTSAPVDLVMDTPKIDPDFRTITTPYVVPGTWVMEANAMLTGVGFTWIKDLLFGDVPDGYAMLEALARDYLRHTETLSGFITVAGASTANTRRGNLYPNGVIAFPTNDLNAGALSRGALAFSAFEAAAYAILQNMEILGEAGSRAPERLCIGGGETRMSLWIELIRATADTPVRLIEADDMTSLGGAILAFVAVKTHPTYGEAFRKMVRGREAADPAWLRARPFAGTFAARKDAWAAAFGRYRIR
jgi:sugar (pentulose or hexulose) kinase